MSPVSGPARRWQAGVSLIELLVAMMLGLVIMGALVVMYLGGGKALRNVQAQAQMNQDAQMVLAAIAHELAQAGYNPVRNTSGAKNDLGQMGWTLFACDTGFTGATDKNPKVGALKCNAAGGGFALAVVYEGDLSTGQKTSAKLPMDCVGNGVAATATPAGASFYIMQARLYVANKALMCRGSGTLTQAEALAENIESMTATFAVADPAAPDNLNVKGYLTATQINDPTYPALAALPLLEERWNKVVAARICIVVVSENIVLDDQDDAGAQPSYLDCGGATVPITDGRLRRAYRSMVLLRNHGVGYS